MQLSAERDESPAELPITPVLPCAANLMLELIHNSPLAAAGKRSQRTRFDYATMRKQLYAGTGEARRQETGDVFKDGTTDRNF
jgi:hypothetical protein